MKNLFLLSLSLVYLVACSEVEFSPLPKAEEQQVGLPVTPPTKAGSINERFKQNDHEAKLDVLMIVDNSTSMAEEQKKLGSRLKNFITQLKDVDWSIAVTTTDVSRKSPYRMDGKIIKFSGSKRKIINKRVKNFKKLFLNTIQRDETNNCEFGECPSSSEQPLRAAIMAMNKADDENSGFFRDGADLAIVILSDEDETESRYEATPLEVKREFKNKWPSKKLTAYGVIVEPNDDSCLNNQDVDGLEGEQINNLVQLTGGTTSSICDDDYGEGLKKIGKNARRLLDFVKLKKLPNPSSLMVFVNGKELNDWLLVGKRLNFKSPPPKGSTIEVSYDELIEEKFLTAN